MKRIDIHPWWSNQSGIHIALGVQATYRRKWPRGSGALYWNGWPRWEQQWADQLGKGINAASKRARGKERG